MPLRPQSPSIEDWMNDVGRRLRDVERQRIQLPDGADPLQTFEDGSPLGDTRFVNFGAGLRAVLTGDDFVEVTGTTAATPEFDAICDCSLTASDPDNRLFKGIGEALQYLYTTIGLTERAFVLVRNHPSSNLINVNRYQETANVGSASGGGMPRHIYLFGTSPFQSGECTIWDHNGFTVNGTNWYIANLTVDRCQATGSPAKTALFTGNGSVYLDECNLEAGGSTSTSLRVCSAGEAVLNRCNVQNGWFKFDQAYDCFFRIYTSGTYSPCANHATPSYFVMDDCYLDQDTLLAGAVTWNLDAGYTYIKFTPNGSSGQSVIPTFNLSGGAGATYQIDISAGGELMQYPKITSTTISWADLKGWFNTITLGAPDSGTSGTGQFGHRLDVFGQFAMDITGPALLDIRTIGAVTLRGKSVAGVIMTRQTGSSGAAVSFIDADEADLLVSGSPRLASTGTHKPLSFDASSANNVVVLSGRSLYAAAYADAGTNNRVLPEGAAPPAAGFAPADADYLVGTANGTLTNEIVVGTTPGGELGNTWASPTVDATHSGSAHTDFIAKALVDAKGDIITATADNTPVRKAVGATNGHALLVDSAQSDGLRYGVAPVLNSAAATTLGTVTKKIEVFDAAGTSLGFIALYDAIT